MTDARTTILGALASTRTAPAHLAGYSGPVVSFADPVAAFRSALEAAGGSLRTFADAAALESALVEAGRDAIVLRGGPAVAESGAVWWVPRDHEQRRAGFLAERVIVVVARADLVADLHAAYQRIDPSAAPYSCFVAGPSKTADIEQALVIGAHGPRALAVFLWGPEGG